MKESKTKRKITYLGSLIIVNSFLPKEYTKC